MLCQRSVSGKRSPRATRATTFVLWVSCALSGCVFPPVHTPHVEPGTHGTFGATLSTGTIVVRSDSTRKLTPPVPSLIFRGSYGLRSRVHAEWPALELGVQGSLGNGGMTDAYFQVPQRWAGDADLGIGAAAQFGLSSGSALMAYVQGGRWFTDRLYIFTTQSVLSVRGVAEGGRRVWWQPMIAIRPKQATDQIKFFFLAGTFGPTTDGCDGPSIPCLTRTPGALVAIGGAVSPWIPTRGR